MGLLFLWQINYVYWKSFNFQPEPFLFSLNGQSLFTNQKETNNNNLTRKKWSRMGWTPMEYGLLWSMYYYGVWTTMEYGVKLNHLCFKLVQLFIVSKNFKLKQVWNKFVSFEVWSPTSTSKVLQYHWGYPTLKHFLTLRGISTISFEKL